MVEEPKKMIPWQDRERLGTVQAFVLTILEVFINPFEYYEKLEESDFYQESIILCLLNSLFLVAPLLFDHYSWVSILVMLAIVVMTPLFMFLLAVMITKILAAFGETISFRKSFHVFAYASPVFLLVLVPQAGYWLATIALTILSGIGLYQVHKIRLEKILPILFVVPLVVLLPFTCVGFAKTWELNNPAIDVEMQAQKILEYIANAAENYARTHDGNYPKSSDLLILPPQQYLTRDYCGTTLHHYSFTCDFRNFGYFVKAQPQGWQGRGKKTFYVITGGKLKSQ